MPESEAVPMSCSGVHVEYRLNGITVSTSGQNITAATYKATPHNRGHLLEQIETWNNQQPNCQGLDSEYVRAHTPAVAYVEASCSELRFFQVENMEVPLFTLTREQPRIPTSKHARKPPNPSIERTSPGKPGAASHVKR
jgi:hypothetical protein